MQATQRGLADQLVAPWSYDIAAGDQSSRSAAALRSGNFWCRTSSGRDRALQFVPDSRTAVLEKPLCSEEALRRNVWVSQRLGAFLFVASIAKQAVPSYFRILSLLSNFY